MNILVTGGCGFIGSNFINYWLKNYPKDNLINLDNLTYAGIGKNLEHIGIADNENYSLVKGDICDSELVLDLIKGFYVDTIVNFAAESHNSRANLDPTIFFRTNVMGTQNLLEAVRKEKIKRFHHISTCEVYGDLSLDSEDKFTEDSPYKPNTPYNASKASADLVAKVYFKTFGVPVTISNCANNYGPYQFPEKLIPLFATNLIENKKVPVYKNSENKREWIHVLDHCKAIDLILRKGDIGETYNVGTGIEKSIEEITEILLKETGKGSDMKKYVLDRPGHDRRYLLDSTKIKNLGWNPEIGFEKGIKETIEWYKQNKDWWRKLKEKTIDEERWSQR